MTSKIIKNSFKRTDKTNIQDRVDYKLFCMATDRIEHHISSVIYYLQNEGRLPVLKTK